MNKLLWLGIILLSYQLPTFGAENAAANAINALGIDLLRQTKAGENTVLSPYSIQYAMAMAYEGADGTTRSEMAKVLHYADAEKMRGSLGALSTELHSTSTNSDAQARKQSKRFGQTAGPFVLTTANRLFGQTGYDFRPVYLQLLISSYTAPFEALDFRSNRAGAAQRINSWVQQQTHDRIRDLISPGAVNDLTRLVLVNAVYLKIPWFEPFEESATKWEPFNVSKSRGIHVRTMHQTANYGYGRLTNMTAVVLPYSPDDLQLLILLPDSRDGIDDVQRQVSPELLATCAALEHQKIILYLPKFKVEPPVFNLNSTFETLGMRQAFDVPKGSANFERMAPRRGEDYLYISDIVHKTFIDVDEHGTEAAAASAIELQTNALELDEPKRIEVRVDHPFLFAIQHRETGACLFLGRVVDPSKN